MALIRPGMRTGFKHTGILAAMLFCATTALVRPAFANAPAAQGVYSANDGHTFLKNAVQILPPHLVPDTLSALVRLPDGLWHVSQSVDAPASVVGPPTALTFSRDGHYAYLSSAARPDIATGKIVPDDRISVIDLHENPARVVQTVRALPGATTLRLTPDGHHLLVADGKSGAVTWFRVADGRLFDPHNIALPVQDGFVGGVDVTADGKRAFASLWKGDRVYTFHISGDDITLDPTPISVAPGAWTLRETPDGHYLTVNVLGHGEGKPGAIAVLDLTTPQLQEVDRVTVPNAPEGTDISPDGRYLAVVSQNGSALPDASPLYHARGVVTVFALENGHLRQLAQAAGTLWPQGLVFSPDGTQILTQGGVDHKLRTLAWNGTTLTVQGDTDLPGAGANLERVH